MIAYFFDSSASVKRFAKESGSAWVLGLLRPSAQNWIYVSSLSLVEVTAAIARRRKGKTLDINQANKSIRRFQRSFESRFLIVEVTPQLLDKAAKIADQHELRGYDAVQLASALQSNRNRQSLGLSAIIFVSADKELNSAAVAESLLVENPNNYP